MSTRSNLGLAEPEAEWKVLVEEGSISHNRTTDQSPMEKVELDSEDDQSFLRVTVFNWDHYVGVKSAQTIEEKRKKTSATFWIMCNIQKQFL